MGENAEGLGLLSERRISVGGTGKWGKRSVVCMTMEWEEDERKTGREAGTGTWRGKRGVFQVGET